MAMICAVMILFVGVKAFYMPIQMTLMFGCKTAIVTPQTPLLGVWLSMPLQVRLIGKCLTTDKAHIWFCVGKLVPVKIAYSGVALSTSLAAVWPLSCMMKQVAGQTILPAEGLSIHMTPVTFHWLCRLTAVSHHSLVHLGFSLHIPSPSSILSINWHWQITQILKLSYLVCKWFIGMFTWKSFAWDHTCITLYLWNQWMPGITHITQKGANYNKQNISYKLYHMRVM